MTLGSTSEFTVFIPVEPAPASRPQVSRYGVRYAKSHQAYIQAFKTWMSSGANWEEWPWLDKTLCEVDLQFYCTKPRTSKLQTPRYDIDNLVKLPLDCITDTGLIWHDDKQITTLTAYKAFAGPEEEAGTWLSVTWPSD